MENLTNSLMTPETKASGAALLNGLLADHFTMMLKIWQFHWNVVGPSFGSYHEDMRKLYEEEFERVDEIAERVRALEQRPLGSMDAMLQNNRIPEFSQNDPVPNAMLMWETIRKDWENLVNRTHEVHSQISDQDIATKSFLENMTEEMEKSAWMIRSRME